MTFRWQRTALIVAGVLALFASSFFLPRASAQDTGGTSAPAGGASQTEQPSAPPTTPAPANGTPATPAATPESAPASAPSAPPPSLSVGGGYGFAPQTLVLGEGRLAKPKLRFSVSVSQGFDDNIYSSSGKTQTEVVPVATTSLVTTQQTSVILIGGTSINITTPVVVPRTTVKPTIRTVPTLDRVASATSGAGLGADLQFASPRTALTFSVGGNLLYYYNRPGSPTDKSGSLNLLFIHKISSRLQFDAQITSSLSSQPDFSSINGPTQPNTGNHILTTARFDLSYQLTARIQMVTTYNMQTASNLGSTTSTTSTAPNNDFFEQTFGEQLKYMATPRAFVVAEVRHTITTHTDSAGDSSSNTFLGGLDFNFSRRLQATLRAGEEIRTYTAVSAPSPSPYFEHTLSYRYGGGSSSVSWTSRYGFEESQTAATQQQLTLRTGLNINHGFTARLQGTFGLNYLSNSDSTIGTSTVVQSNQSIDTSLGLNFFYSPKLSFNASITHSEVFSSDEFSSYSRDRVSIGGSYSY